MKVEKVQQHKINANVMMNLQNEIDDKNEFLNECNKCKNLKGQTAIVLKEKLKLVENLEAKLQIELTTNIKLPQDIVKLTNALSSKTNENQSLAKKLASSGTKIRISKYP